MFSETTNEYRKDLFDGLVLRTPTSIDDIDRVAEFHSGIHSAGVGPFVRNLLLNHPKMTAEDQVFVETDTGEVVSALCLVPWQWDMEGALLDVGELAVVATAEAYRRRGLIREQMVYFMDRLNQKGYVLSHIQGIPFYYRQFGYDYALPLDGGYLLELRNIPEYKGTDTVFRKATIDDIDTLAAMYDETVADLSIRSRRDEDIWRYLITLDDPADDMFHDAWICEDSDGAAIGYIRIPHRHFGDELVIDEAMIRKHEAANALLAHVKKLATERNKPGVRLSLPSSNYLVQYGLALGARSMGNYAFQIHVPDKVRLLKAMRPALEARLVNTPMSDWSTPLDISFYTEGLTLTFEHGRITSIQAGKAKDNSAVSMPVDAFMPLVLGYRSVEETHANFPDFGVVGENRLLLKTLFPKRESHIYQVY